MTGKMNISVEVRYRITLVLYHIKYHLWWNMCFIQRQEYCYCMIFIKSFSFLPWAKYLWRRKMKRLRWLKSNLGNFHEIKEYLSWNLSECPWAILWTSLLLKENDTIGKALLGSKEENQDGSFYGHGRRNNHLATIKFRISVIAIWQQK